MVATSYQSTLWTRASDKIGDRQPRYLSVMTQLDNDDICTAAVHLHVEFQARGIASHMVFLSQKETNAFLQRDYSACMKRPPTHPAHAVKILATLRAQWKSFQPTAVFAHTMQAIAACATMKLIGMDGDLVTVHHRPFRSYSFPSRKLDGLFRRVHLYAGELAVGSTVAASLPPQPRKDGLRRRVMWPGHNLAESKLTPQSARESYGLPEEAFVIGGSGELIRENNFEFLLDLLPHLPDVYLLVMGEGAYRARLAKQAIQLGIHERVSLPGKISLDRLPDFLRAVDLFTVPSATQDNSAAALEACRLGIPTICEEPSVASALRSSSGPLTGAVPLPLKSADWIAIIRRIRFDSLLQDELARRERSNSVEFTIERVADRYIAFTQELRFGRNAA